MTMSSNRIVASAFRPRLSRLSLRDVELILAAWDRRQLREHPRVGSALRPDLRQYAEAAPATTRRQVVHGRGVRPHPRQAAISLARVRPGRKCSRHPSPEPAQRHNSQAVLPQAITASSAVIT
jgi:hypothetical protein